MPRTLYIFDQGLKGLVGHYYEYVRSIVVAAEQQGIRCIVGCHKEAGEGDFASFKLHSIFRDDVWGTIPGEDYHAAASLNGVSNRFLEDVRSLLLKYPPQPGDIVFLPNIAKPHIVAAALVAELFGPLGVSTHLMFRYPSGHFEGDVATNSFRRLEAAAAIHDVSFCTDSHRLADELAPLSSLPFVVFPIPHTWHDAGKPMSAADDQRPLHCVSLGNARDEKGMAEILEAVRLSANTAWGQQLRFTLQVNNPYQVEDAIKAFKAGPIDPRTILIDEAMSSEDYAALLDSADVVLVPYWRSIYRERTSGVFLEGLIKGKLVLCTRDTWMSDLFDLHEGGVAVDDKSGHAVADGLRLLVEQRAELQSRARRAAAYWQGIHCPENLVAHLTGENARPVHQRRRGGKAAVLFPWGEAVSGKTGAALRLKYFVRYMETVYDEVRILFTGGAEPGGVIGKRSMAEPHHYSEEAKALHEQLKKLCRDLSVPEEQCFHLWYHLWPERDAVFRLRCEELVLWADHVYVDYSYFCSIIDDLCRKHGKEYTVTFHDIVSDQSKPTLFLHQATRSLELQAARNAPRLICPSDGDQKVLASEGIASEVIPHPIDAQEARSPFSREEAYAILEDLYGLSVRARPLCFFVGSFYPPNVEAAEEIARIAQACVDAPGLHNVQFVVAGGCMDARRTGNLTALGMIEGAALSAIMTVADIILIPLLRGTGVSLKSIEALARGALILSTSIGMRGLDVIDGVHCRIEDDMAHYPTRIAELLGDEPGARRMRDLAQKFGAQFDFRTLMALYLPGTPQKGNLEESAGEFADRRNDFIAELLPRIRTTGPVSPLLKAWAEQGAPRILAGSEPTAGPAIVPELGNTPAGLSGPRAVATAREMISDVFDPDWYLASYPDVGMLGMDPTEHYAWIGKELGRAPNECFKKKRCAATGL